MNKKTSVFIITILIVIIAIMGYFLYKFNNDKNVAIDKANNYSQQIKELEKKSAVETKDVETKATETEKAKDTKTTSVEKMTIELAYGILNKYKAEHVSDSSWYIGKVELKAHGDNNTYLVYYDEVNSDGYTTTLGTIIEYKNGKWTTDLPGFNGMIDDDFTKYNFVDY